MNKHQEELLLDNYYTIAIAFSTEATAKLYTYKVDKSMKVKEDDFVVVNADGQCKIVQVKEVHEENQIDFSTNFRYKYIIDILDFTTYNMLKERSQAIAKALAEAARRRLKTEMLESLTNEMDEADIKKLSDSCGGDFLGRKT